MVSAIEKTDDGNNISIPGCPNFFELRASTVEAKDKVFLEVCPYVNVPKLSHFFFETWTVYIFFQNNHHGMGNIKMKENQILTFIIL